MREMLSGYADRPNTTFSQTFLTSVAMGLVPGYSFVDKFGENPVITTATDPEDIWEGGGTYIYDADGTAPIVSIISDNVGNTQEVSVQGLDIEGLLVSQTITLNGTSRVPLTTPLWRVFRMQNLGAANIAGTVYCYVGTGGIPVASNIRAVMASANQTLMCIYTIPTDKVGLLLFEEVGASRATSSAEVRVSTKVRKKGGVFSTKRRVNLSSTGTSIDRHYNTFPDVLPGGTDIKQTVEEVSATLGVFGTFQILLVDEYRLPLSFLDRIGHPA